MPINQRKAGVILSYLSMSLNILIGFLYLPILLRYLGKAEYGLYQLMGSVIAYLAVMDFGLSSTITRYYSRYLALNDHKRQSNVLAVSSIIYSLISVILVILGSIIYLNLDKVFSNSLSIYELIKAKQIFIIMLINVAITIPSHIFTAIINSHERFIFLRVLSIIQTVMQPILILFIMRYRADAVSLVVVQSVLNIITIVLKAYYSFCQIGVQIKLYFYDKIFIREILVFSFFIFMNTIIDQIYWKTGHIILGIISGTSVVAIYSIAIQLVMYYINFSANINSVFLPRISAITARTEDMTEINQIFNKVGRIQFTIMSLILTGFVLYGREFMGIWIGKDFVNAYYMSLVIMIPLTIPLIQNMGIIILQAKNKHAFRSKIYFIIAIINIVISIPLAKLYGGLGPALGTAMGLFIGNIVVINIYYHRVIGINIIAFTKEIYSMSIPAFISLAIGTIIKWYLEVKTLEVLALNIIVYTFIFMSFMWLLGFNDYEKGLLKNGCLRIKKRMGKLIGLTD